MLLRHGIISFILYGENVDFVRALRYDYYITHAFLRRGQLCQT